MPTDSSLFVLLLLLTISASCSVGLAAGVAGDSPFTAKAALIRHWKKQVSGGLPSSFFINKASPLDAVQLAKFSKLADQHSLSAQLSSFCQAADLLCFPDPTTSLEKHGKDVKFSEYKFQNFTNYGTDRHGGVDSFKNYTNNDTFPIDTFRRYSRDSVRHDDEFTNYALESIVPNQIFNSYGTKSTGGTGEFNNYQDKSDVPGLTFNSYSDSTNGRVQDFKTYSEDTKAGVETFTRYGKNGDGATNEFSNYANTSTGSITSTFNNYAETSNRVTDNFTSYGLENPIPENDFNNYATGGNETTDGFIGYGSDGSITLNNFKKYGTSGNGISQTFANYRDGTAVVGDNTFQSYADESKAASMGFTNYGRSFLPATFKEYAKDSKAQTVNFRTYKEGNTFKGYAKTGVTFANYINESATSLTAASMSPVKHRWVEAGKFFREKMLKTGTVMPMPDIKDKMPKRSFLPRTILSKLPFSSNNLDELKKVFHATDDSRMSRILGNALSECERAPSPGETKLCTGSGEDMIDFATSVLGKNVAVRTTENTRGSGGEIMIGTVTGINGGQLTKSVSCHQSLYPYLLYYCHSVPKVRVYGADILDPKSMDKINHGVAICHIDTSTWSQNHGAFMALGLGPGKIEVCHWIFENDMTWTVSD